MTDEKLAQIDDLRTLFLTDVPLLDVRAPVEFAEGAFPSAENHPLIDDDERHAIGIAYKHEGQDAAITLGEGLVSGDKKAQRIAHWQDFLRRHPDAVLYCFRGGMRSQISQRWLLEHAGLRCPRVRGGYKAMRRFLLDELARSAAVAQPIVIGGRTGVGKTRFLAHYDAAIDLEKLAHHRGSAFGHHPQPQPSQIDFENALSVALMKRLAHDPGPILVEDESRNIGGRHIPEVLFSVMHEAPLVILEASDDERIAITLQEYVHDALGEFTALYGEQQGFERWSDYLANSMDRIRRRLGGDRHAHVRKLLDEAVLHHRSTGDVNPHCRWIGFLLHEYYDGMYSFQLDQKSQRIVFRGTRDQVADYLAHEHGIVAVRTD
ncbi:MAG: tRNA 2-selenouridine(34) synthase MnmH [Gammaproteobacteria bacterium]|nr:tRNA 2-selenouridine(34) synthase MnmH [Gammaproteobacteria bacterium]